MCVDSSTSSVDEPGTTTVVEPGDRLNVECDVLARYVGRYGWVSAHVTDAESLENALEWLRESYWLKAPANLRSAVEET